MMTPSELIGEGINLMFSGMGFVLVFLLILIFLVIVKSLSYLNCWVRRWCAIAAAITGRKRSKSSVGAAESAVEVWEVFGSG